MVTNHAVATTSGNLKDTVMFSEIMSCKLNLCEHCILGKQKRVWFTASTGKSVFFSTMNTVKGNRLWVLTACNEIISRDIFVSAKSMQKEKQQTPKLLLVEVGMNKDESEYRARLVAKGYMHNSSIDFNETFSPIVKLTAIRVYL